MAKSLLGLVIALMVSGTMCRASEPYVSGTYAPVAQGYLVQFIIYNQLSHEVLCSWGVVTADAASVASPPGWDLSQNFREVSWRYHTPADQLQPGESLSGFGFITQSAPGPLSFWILSNSAGYRGSVTPTAVPEPFSLLALGSGLMVLGGLPWIRRRVRARA